MDVGQDFGSFTEARWSSLYRLARLLTGSASDAEDLLQESLEKTYLRWSRISRTEAPEAYVRRLMVNTLISSHRRPAWRREVLRRRLPEPTVDSPELAVLDHEQLWPLICALPPRQRAVIVLRYYEDLSEHQIADVLGCSTGSVKSQAHDAMVALRRGADALRVTGEVVTEP